MKNYSSLLLTIGIIALLALLSGKYFKRFDLTSDKQYTLSGATKNILKAIEDPVTVTAYFTEDLDPEREKTKRDFRDMLIEYSSLSKGMIDYEFINPNESEETEKTAQQNGIAPQITNVRERDQVQQRRIYMGAILKMGEQQEIIPAIQNGTAMEYALSTSIKKMTVVDKPSIGLIQGYGSPTWNDLAQVYQSLSILYNPEPLDLNSAEPIPERFRTIALVAPSDSIPPAHFAKLDEYLSRGGNLFIAANGVSADLSSGQGTALTTGLEGWLRQKGVEVENSFLIDASCGNVTVQQQQGFFMVNTPIQFPFLPLIKNFADHPITKGIEQVMLPFASPVRYVGENGTTFTPLIFSSQKSGVLTAPLVFDVQKRWGEGDFPMASITLGGLLEGNLVGNNVSRIVVIGDGDFPVSQQGRGQAQDNINLMVNSIDFLSDDTGLIELRTKGVASRPLNEIEDSRRSLLKWLNFLLPIGLVIGYGFFRYQIRRSRRLERMQENYG